MRVGAIDIGTNTFLCLIAEVRNGLVENVLSDEVEIVRIGEGVHKNRAFLPEALERADKCLARFRARLDEFRVTQVQAVATSAARDVSNGQALLDLGIKHRIPIKIIEGAEEARLTFQGVKTNPAFGSDIAVVDVGGGSTEIIFENASGELSGASVDIGGVRLTESCVTGHPIGTSELQAMREYSKRELRAFPKLQGKTLIAVAGTPTTLAALEEAIDYQQQRIEGYRLGLEVIEKWILRLSALGLEERSKLKGLEPKRADIIVAGAVILAESALALGGASYVVSTRGVRYGVAAELGRDQ